MILLQGDNLRAMEFLLREKNMAGGVELIYTDPPFATGNTFTVSATRANTISRARRGDVAYSDKFGRGEFLSFLKERLMMMKELLSDKGSIYLHIDYKIGHYVKVLMDEVFGAANFRNDIARIKCNPKNSPRVGFGNTKDMILFYTKGRRPIWHAPAEPYTKSDLARLFPKTDPLGRRYTTIPLHAPGETKSGGSGEKFKGLPPPPGRHWRTDINTLARWDEAGLLEWSRTGNPRKIMFADERRGKKMQDVWGGFKDPQTPAYPTEKNLGLAEMMIRASSDPGGVVLDCFCGSGTTLLAAANCGRKWIGMDESPRAIQSARKKLNFFRYEFVKI